jgi:hypothetical protein
MQEICIPEFLVLFFLSLYILRPVFKKLRPVNGLAWLPLPAFFVMAALIPAYGLRPESLPLFLMTAILAGSVAHKRLSDSGKFGGFRRAKLAAVLPLLIALAAAGGTAFYFTPEKDPALITGGVYSTRVDGGGASGAREYFIRVYSGEDEGRPPEKRPLLLLLPPMAGSQGAVDMVAAELRGRGFTVVTYSRRGFDSPALRVSDPGKKPRRYGISPAERLRRFSAVSSGTVSVKANALGRALEEARKDDLEFLMAWLAQNPRVEEGRLSDRALEDAVFLAGYDAGGSALILSAPSFPQARGLIAVESPLWSLYRAEPAVIPEPPARTGRFQSLLDGLVRRLWGTKPRKTDLIMTGPSRAAAPPVPLLILASDRIREPNRANNRYRALLEVFGAAGPLSMLVSVDGAGPLDYSDFPAKNPLGSALRSGRARNMPESPAVTAAIITWFAASVLTGEERALLRPTALPAGVRVDAK